jgi:hypothetical protein
MGGEPTPPAGSRRARVALLVAGAAVLLAAAVGVGAALGAAGGHDRQPGGPVEAVGAGATVGGQESGATVAGGGGGSGGSPASGGTGGGGTGGASGGTSKGWPAADDHRQADHHPGPKHHPAADRDHRGDLEREYLVLHGLRWPLALPCAVPRHRRQQGRGDGALPVGQGRRRRPGPKGQPFIATMVHTICP